MTQADISALTPDEVDFSAGTITRKRTKTGDYAGVPVVCYPLWKSTLALLKKHRNPKARTILTNEDGGQLKNEKITDDGKYTKNDNIAVAYYRLCVRAGIEHKPLKLLRKTSASLLYHSEKFSQYAPLFLGHAARTIAEKNYYGKAGQSFTDAIRWLGSQYGQ